MRYYSLYLVENSVIVNIVLHEVFSQLCKGPLIGTLSLLLFWASRRRAWPLIMFIDARIGQMTKLILYIFESVTVGTETHQAFLVNKDG